MRAEETAAVAAGLDELLLPDDQVVDVGSGTGHYARLLSARCARVVAVEPNPEMSRHLGASLVAAGAANVEVRRGGLPDGLVSEPMDGLVCIGVLQYLPDLEASVRAIASAIRPGGWAIFTVTPRTRESRWYALEERVTRRRITRYTDDEVRHAASLAGLEILGARTAAGVTRVITARRVVAEGSGA